MLLGNVPDVLKKLIALILKDIVVHKKIPGGSRVQLLCLGERL